jgi:haloalkane dehalogenase
VLAEHPRQLSPSWGSRPTTRKAPIKRDGRTAARSYDCARDWSRNFRIGMTGVFRTPTERFEGLPDFGYEPCYRNVRELRIAHLDVGEGAPVVMLHGALAWSFIWRKVIPPVRDAGYRCLIPDHAGFGRSDKPTDHGWHSLERHVVVTGSLLEDLDLRDVTFVLHDWGVPIGLTLAVAQPERVARIVLLDGVLDFREVWMNEIWVRFRGFAESTPDLPVGALMQATCFHDPGADVLAAYDAPFPSPESKAAVRGLPMSVATKNDMAAAAAVERFYEALRTDSTPKLMLWAENDHILTLASGQRLASRIGGHIDHVIPEAGHGLLEDQGPLIGDVIAGWLLSRG